MSTLISAAMWACITTAQPCTAPQAEILMAALSACPATDGACMEREVARREGGAVVVLRGTR